MCDYIRSPLSLGQVRAARAAATAALCCLPPRAPVPRAFCNQQAPHAYLQPAASCRNVFPTTYAAVVRQGPAALQPIHSTAAAPFVQLLEQHILNILNVIKALSSSPAPTDPVAPPCPSTADPPKSAPAPRTPLPSPPSTPTHPCLHSHSIDLSPRQRTDIWNAIHELRCKTRQLQESAELQSRKAEADQDKLAIMLQGGRDVGVQSDQAQTQQAQEHLNNVDQAVESVAASVAELRQRYERLDAYAKTLAKLVQQKEFRFSDMPAKELDILVGSVEKMFVRRAPALLNACVRDAVVPQLLDEVKALVPQLQLLKGTT